MSLGDSKEVTLKVLVKLKSVWWSHRGTVAEAGGWRKSGKALPMTINALAIRHPL